MYTQVFSQMSRLPSVARHDSVTNICLCSRLSLDMTVSEDVRAPLIRVLGQNSTRGVDFPAKTAILVTAYPTFDHFRDKR